MARWLADWRSVHKESWVFKSQYMSRYTISFSTKFQYNNTYVFAFVFVNILVPCHFFFLVPFRNRYWHIRNSCVCFYFCAISLFYVICVNTDLLLNNKEFRGSAQTKILIQLSYINLFLSRFYYTCVGRLLFFLLSSFDLIAKWMWMHHHKYINDRREPDIYSKWFCYF